MNIGPASWVLIQRPDMGVLLDGYGEPMPDQLVSSEEIRVGMKFGSIEFSCLLERSAAILVANEIAAACSGVNGRGAIEFKGAYPGLKRVRRPPLLLASRCLRVATHSSLRCRQDELEER